MEKKLKIAGRIAFATPMAILGLFHFLNGPAMAEMILAGWPAAEALVYVSGAGLIAAAVAIVINKHAKLAALFLALEIFLIILTVHAPGLTNEATMQMSMTNLLKDLSLMGGALIIAAISD